MMPEPFNFVLQETIREAAERLAQNPGVLMIKVEPLMDASVPLRHEGWTTVFAAWEMPDSFHLPQQAARIRVTAFGAFEPMRPTDTPQTLLAELNRERRIAGYDPMPRGTDVKSLGLDDLGYLSYQMSIEHIVEGEGPLCERAIACPIPA